MGLQMSQAFQTRLQTHSEEATHSVHKHSSSLDTATSFVPLAVKSKCQTPPKDTGSCWETESQLRLKQKKKKTRVIYLISEGKSATRYTSWVEGAWKEWTGPPPAPRWHIYRHVKLPSSRPLTGTSHTRSKTNFQRHIWLKAEYPLQKLLTSRERGEKKRHFLLCLPNQIYTTSEMPKHRWKTLKRNQPCTYY